MLAPDLVLWDLYVPCDPLRSLPVEAADSGQHLKGERRYATRSRRWRDVKRRLHRHGQLNRTRNRSPNPLNGALPWQTIYRRQRTCLALAVHAPHPPICPPRTPAGRSAVGAGPARSRAERGRGRRGRAARGQGRLGQAQRAAERSAAGAGVAGGGAGAVGARPGQARRAAGGGAGAVGARPGRARQGGARPGVARARSEAAQRGRR
ncbi:hypothetical protein GUJ93_ZPchr0014g46974 [Zizania palustris]|uniref:Uncharacterized protein n=1 Tax=Zizania palustris TaxID=103762 RepID=A0A8J5SWN8_ZIZPA|nr:hypothetical protein GUJ93_ZPchr0014g46974 [Zizania palustris]